MAPSTIRAKMTEFQAEGVLTLKAFAYKAKTSAVQ